MGMNQDLTKNEEPQSNQTDSEQSLQWGLSNSKHMQ